MKLPHVDNKTLIQGMQRTGEIGISQQNSALIEMFLRDKIYSDKPKAVVREYLANAIDEHRKLKIKRPVEITIEDSSWSVRDYGLGLSEDDIFDIFFTYCASTKSHDSQGMGGFGIGSKSGHAYTDRFFVTSYFGGKESTYVGIVASDCGKAKGKAHLVSSSPSSEPTGIKVSVPLKNGDDLEFIKNSEHYATLSRFPVLVNSEKPAKYEVAYKGNNWKYFKDPNPSAWRRNQVPTWVTAGDIAYPTKLDIGGLLLFGEVEDLDLALNKETPEYTDKTKATIQKLQTIAIKELAEEINKSLKGKNYWERREQMNSLSYDIKDLVEQSIPSPNKYYKRFVGAKQRASSARNGFSLSSKDRVYHVIGDSLPRNFWKSFPTFKENIYVQYWESQALYDKGIKDPEEFWALAPQHQLLLASSVNAPKFGGGSMAVAKPSWADFGNLTRKKTKDYYNTEYKITYKRNAGQEEADKQFEAGGYYYQCPRGAIKEDEFDAALNTSKESINVFTSLKLADTSEIQIVGCIKSALPKFKKAKQWKPLEDLVATIITADKIKKEKRSRWAKQVLNETVSLVDHWQCHVEITVKEMLDKDFVNRLIGWSKEQYVGLQYDGISTKRISKSLRKKLLTKAPEQLYSFVGAKVLKTDCADQKLNEIKKQLK